MMLAVDGIEGISTMLRAITSVIFAVMTATAIYVAYGPAKGLVLRQEQMFDHVICRDLLIDIRPRIVSIIWLLGGVLMLVLGFAVYDFIGAIIGLAVAAVMPWVILRTLRLRRLRKLEDQLVNGIMTLSSGVRAGLNLVQAMQMVARDNPRPISQEFAHLMKEYEYGIPLEEAMENAAVRIGSGNYRLLLAALQTHRERGGDLGITLDRIAESIREIQRLEKRVQTLTAQGRATARWLGIMPVVIIAIVSLIDPSGIETLFHEPIGNLLLLIVLLLNVAGFLWIKKIVSIDI